MNATAMTVREAPALVLDREKIDLIKKTVCPQGISDGEFALFIEQCRRSGLDPLIKQAFCVERRMRLPNGSWVKKHEFQPAEAGMLARAETFPDFRGIQAAAVYENDEIEIDPGAGVVAHKFRPSKDRGRLIGAWAKIERENRAPVVVWLNFDDYKQTTKEGDLTSMWSRLGATMIVKCARVAALRVAYPAAFGGLYIREEMPPEEFEEKPMRLVESSPSALPEHQPDPEEADPFAQQVADAIAAIDAAQTEEDLKQCGHLLAQSYPKGHPVLNRVREHWNARMQQIRQGVAA